MYRHKNTWTIFEIRLIWNMQYKVKRAIKGCAVSWSSEFYSDVTHRNLAHLSCTGYLWAADREKYNKKCTAVFAFTSPKSRLSKNLDRALPLSYRFLFFDPVNCPPLPSPQTYPGKNKSFHLPDAPVDPPAQPHLLPLVPLVFSVYNQNHMPVQWPLEQSLLHAHWCRQKRGWEKRFRIFPEVSDHTETQNFKCKPSALNTMDHGWKRVTGFVHTQHLSVLQTSPLFRTSDKTPRAQTHRQLMQQNLV